MTHADRERALAAFRLGLGRQAMQPQAAWAEHPLAALAMAGQALRLQRPQPQRRRPSWLGRCPWMQPLCC